MNEDSLKALTRDAFAARQGEASDFASTWTAAEMRHRRSQHRIGAAAGVAASIALIAVTLVLWPSREPTLPEDLLTADALLTTTQWSAPSDVLMPEHRFDIFSDLPELDESTDLF